MAFDYEAARAEGYSDAEIADYLAKQNKFDIQGARKEGYSSEEILSHLAPVAGFEFKPPQPQQGAAAGSARYGAKPTDQQTEYTQGKTSNPFHGLFARAANIAGEGIEAVARVAEAGGDYLESKIPLSGLTEEQIKNDKQLQPLFRLAESAKNWSKSIGYEPSVKLNELGENPLKVVPFIAERLISSSPDMAAAVYAAPAYFTSRTNEILNDRLKNDEKALDDVTVGDVTAAAGAAALELTLERFATKHLLKGAPITGKNAYTRVGKELAFQSGTEGAEEAIGYLGGAAGTKKGVDAQELSQQALEGAIVGGGLGGAVKGTQEYYDYRQKKKAALMAEGVDEDIADKTIQNMDAQRDAMAQATAAREQGETDLKKLSDEYFGREYGELEAAPVAAQPVAKPVEVPEVAAPEAPAEINPFAQGMQDVKSLAVPTAELPAAPLPPVTEPSAEVILQNRDRSTPASVSQMQNIASNPDYLRLGTSNVATVGAPIVFGAEPVAPQNLGVQTVITDERGNRYPMQYAVVEADNMMPSNNADGSQNADYSTFQGLRAIGGNGRLAGLQESYQRGAADGYRTELLADQSHGVDPAVIEKMANPVLVRLMDPNMVDETTADNFNVSGAMDLSLVDQAANDARRVDLTKLDTDDNGNITIKALKEFISAMPQNELATLMDKNGNPTNQAIERLEAAVFQQAYENPALVSIAYESADNEARNIIKAMTAVAPQMMRLAGTEYDIRQDLVSAVEKAISARRSGLSLQDAARQVGIGEGPMVNDFVQIFADNARSAKAISGYLNDFANAAYEETTQPAEGLFGETPRRSIEQLKEKLKPVETQDLFAAAEKAPKEAPKKTREEKIEVNEKSHLPDGSIIKDKSGKKYRVHYQRNGLVVAHPIIRGKPQVSADTTVRFWVDKTRTPSGDFDRTDNVYIAEATSKTTKTVESIPTKTEAEVIPSLNVFGAPARTIAQKYENIDQELFVEAFNAGLNKAQIEEAVGDLYGVDDTQAVQNLIDAIADRTGHTPGNWSITMRQPLNNAKNEDVRREKIVELQSLKQRMAAIQRRFAKAALQPLDETTYASLHKRSAVLRDAIRDTYEPNTTPEKFMADAAQQLAKGEIDQEVFDVIDYMYRKQPNVLDGLRLSVRKHKTEMGKAAGQFNGMRRIVTLFKETEGVWDSSTVRHELCHSLEQMMPEHARVRLYNAWREALLRAQKADKSEAGQRYFEKVAAFLERPNQATKVAAIEAMPNTSYYQYLTPSEFWAVNAEPLMAAEMGGAWAKFKKSARKFYEAVKHVFGIANHFDIMRTFDQIINGERISQGVLDDYFINTGYAPVFSISKRQNYEGGKPPENTWVAQFPVRFQRFNDFLNKYKEHWFGTADTNWMDTRIYNNVDKFIDLKRVQQAIGTIQARFDAYMKETLYHGKVATQLKRFEKFQLEPLLKKMAEYGVTKDQLNKFLHNRHAEEYNNHINKINPNAQNGGPLQDRGSGISTEDARAYLDSLSAKESHDLNDLASMVDKMVEGTQDILVNGGIEKADTVEGWRKAFPKYVPLYRTELDFANTSAGIGRGFSTQAGFGKSATGSLKDVDDIFSNIAAQRERAIVRAEKAEVSRAIFGIALQNPNVDFWLPVDPLAIQNKEKLYERLRNMGLEAEAVGKNLIKEPEVPYIDASGMVAYRPNSIARNSPSVLAVPVDGETKYIFFNPSDARALRMVESLKNLDAKALEGAMRRLAMVTRWIAAVNTQYNPVFGLWNFWRDTQGAQLNLSTTPIHDRKWQVMRDTFPALRGIYQDLRAFREGKTGKSEWAKEWNEFMEQGGQTGYRDQFAKTEEQASIIDRKIREMERSGIRHIPAKMFVDGLGGWMSDFNETLENAVRLSAYRAAKEKLTKEGKLSDAEVKAKAAEIGKNLTVNFNRKGALSQNRNAFYAFYNAAVQGSARMLDTLRGPKGVKIMGSLLALGASQSLWMMAAGYDEDEPPEFIRERNIVLPLPNGQYAMWPMPLGFNSIVNVGRIGTDILLNATFREGKSPTKKAFDLLSVATDAFNPLGSGNLSLQTFAPTAADPLVAIATNKDAFGRPIYKADQATNPTPGYLRAREGAYTWSTLLAQGLNMLSGGTKYQKGLISPTPEELEFLAGQATGGAGREAGKAASFFRDLYTGEETAPYKIPVAGRVYGDIKAQANVSSKFYDNIVELANYENEIKGRRKNKEDVQEFFDKHPEAKLWPAANRLENQISKMKKLRREAFEKDNKDRVKAIDEQIKRSMDQFNRRIDDARKQ